MNAEKQVKKTAQITGKVLAAEDSIISYGAKCIAQGKEISIGSGSMILENTVLRSTEEFPVKIGQKTVLGHRCKVTGANIGSLCEIGNGVEIGEGCYIGDYAILGEGTILPPGAKVASRAVVLGHPFYTLRGLTVEDKERIAQMRGGDVSLKNLPLVELQEQEPEEKVEALITYKDKSPELSSAELGNRVEIIGDVIIGPGAIIEEDVKIIGDGHGPVRIGENVRIGKGTVIHMLPGKEVVIGGNVMIGKDCVIHGCTIEDRATIEDFCLVSDHAHIGKNAVVKKASLVPQGRKIPQGASVEGYPVKK